MYLHLLYGIVSITRRFKLTELLVTCALKRDAQVVFCKGFFFTCALKRDAQVVFCKGFYFFFGISHSPRTPLGHARWCSICKHYVDKLQRFSPECHKYIHFNNANCFRLTLWGCLWRKIAENTLGSYLLLWQHYIYCKFDHLISDVCVAHCTRRLPPIPFSPGSNLGGDCFVFCFFVF